MYRLYIISYDYFILNHLNDFLIKCFKLKNCKREKSFKLIKISSPTLYVLSDILHILSFRTY